MKTPTTNCDFLKVTGNTNVDDERGSWGEARQYPEAVEMIGPYPRAIFEAAESEWSSAAPASRPSKGAAMCAARNQYFHDHVFAEALAGWTKVHCDKEGAAHNAPVCNVHPLQASLMLVTIRNIAT